MKTMKTNRPVIGLAALLGALLAAPALAQPTGTDWGGCGMTGGGMGGCGGCGMMGNGPCVTGGGMGGAGMGNPGMGGRGMRFNRQNTAGWNLMTPEERVAHREKMFAAKTYDECKRVQAEQHTLMQARAKEQGVALPDAPRGNACERMRARGFVKP